MATRSGAVVAVVCALEVVNVMNKPAVRIANQKYFIAACP
jgi:hypothetical protein